MIKHQILKNCLGIICFFFCLNVGKSKCIFSQNLEVKELPIGNLVEWSTLMEQNSKYFAIQMSKNGIDFETIGRVDGAGDSKNELQYEFLDVSTGHNQVFYKIIEVDTKGIEAFSQIIALQRNSNNDFAILQMSSTITDKFFELTAYAAVSAACSYEIVNMSEMPVLADEIALTKGTNSISINLAGIPLGKYYVRFNVNDELDELLIRKVESQELPKLNLATKN